jgi:hypothetical protein
MNYEIRHGADCGVGHGEAPGLTLSIYGLCWRSTAGHGRVELH